MTKYWKKSKGVHRAFAGRSSGPAAAARNWFLFPIYYLFFPKHYRYDDDDDDVVPASNSIPYDTSYDDEKNNNNRVRQLPRAYACMHYIMYIIIMLLLYKWCDETRASAIAFGQGKKIVSTRVLDGQSDIIIIEYVHYCPHNKRMNLHFSRTNDEKATSPNSNHGIISV